MTSLQALIFDVDGTLADTEADGHRPAFNDAFAAAGLPWVWDHALYEKLLAVTGGKERIKHYLQTQRPADGVQFSDHDIAALHQAKNRYYAQRLAEGKIPLRPGVRRLLQEARDAGLRLAIATTTSPENVTALLDSALAPGSAAWFEVIAAGDIVPAKKPAPDIYVYALQALGLAPAQALAFEDSENGLRAARGAGLRTLISVNVYTTEHDFSGATLVVDHLGEPDLPLQVLAGTASGATQVDLSLLRELAI